MRERVECDGKKRDSQFSAMKAKKDEHACDKLTNKKKFSMSGFPTRNFPPPAHPDDVKLLLTSFPRDLLKREKAARGFVCRRRNCVTLARFFAHL